MAYRQGAAEATPGYVPSRQLTSLLDQVSVGGLAVVLETLLMFVALAGVFNQLQDALDYIWGVEPKPRDGLLSRARRRFLSILGVLGMAFLLLVSLVLTTLFTAGGQAVFSHVPGPETVNQLVFRGVSFIAVTLIFAMILSC
jgi:membrane protein